MTAVQNTLIGYEKWVPVVGYEGIYDVSDHGRVRRMKAGQGAVAGKILKSCINTGGYPQIQLRKNGAMHTISLHRLVASSFIGPCPSGKEINHLDGDKTHNYPYNLEYTTHKENHRHASHIGLLNPARGERCPRARLTEQDVHTIRRLLPIQSQASIARKFGVVRQAIFAISRGFSWGWLKERK